MPYTYLIGWSKFDKYYYGVRFAKHCDPTELMVSYFTSSKLVKNYFNENGKPDIIQIRKIFNDVDTARLWENKVLRRMKVIDDHRFLNQTNNISFSKESCLRGLETQKDKGIGFFKVGRKNTRLKKLNESRLGELNHMWKIGENHPHYGKRGLEMPMYGKKQSDYQKQKSSEKIECPHCHLLANKGNIIRWHMDNCKRKGEKNVVGEN